MNREERQQRRQKDTKHAMMVFVGFLLAIVLLAAGLIFALTKFVHREKPTEPVPQTEATEETEPTEELDIPVVPVIDPAAEQAAEITAGMTLENKIAQMFMITPEALTGFSGVTAAGDTTKEAYSNRPVGGIVYLSGNLKDTEQTTTMLTNMKAIAKEKTGLLPFLGVDEEGGSVVRIAGNSAFAATDVGDMSAIGATGDTQNAFNAGTVMGTYLKELGFNVDFAPVADVLTNPDNTVIGKRSFGSDSQMVAGMVEAELNGLASQGIYGVVKHFPGHGGTTGDSHNEAVTLDKTLEELMAEEFVPFKKVVDMGTSFVMVGHITVPNVTGDTTPASVSRVMITDVLRSQLGYDGIVITDAMNMAAITNSYTADQAAVMAVTAGADMILMPQDYETAYNGLLEAVHNGTISEERINESVIRIVKVKMQMTEE